MARIEGLRVENDTRGKALRIIINVRKFENIEFIEDLLDLVACKKRKDDETVPWDELKKKINRKHSIKTV